MASMPTSTPSPSDAVVAEWSPPRPRPRRSYGYNELREMAYTMQPRIFAGAQLDMARQMVALHISQVDPHGRQMVLRPEWVECEPGTLPPVPPLFLTEQDARHLAESAAEATGRRNERQRWESRHEEDRAEIRSLANQLEQARDRSDDLADQVAFLRRTVRWLEQELRDANRERRGAFDPTTTPEAPARSEFDG
jgi:hypothetical protein